MSGDSLDKIVRLGMKQAYEADKKNWLATDKFSERTVVGYAGHQHTSFMSHAKPRQIIRLYTFTSHIINLINVNKYDINSNLTNKSTRIVMT